jgi:hypothetical protein
MKLKFKSKGHNSTQSSNTIPDEVDFLLVGAGMSSLYTAWRLLEDNKKKNEQLPEKDRKTLKIAILDMIDRTGGRLDSDLININGNTVKEEEGGMRFTFNSMDNLMSLFLYLDLVKDMVPFPMGSGGNNRLYFRGQAMTNKEGLKDDVNIWSELYALEPSESGFNPKDMINTVYNRILSVNTDFLKIDEYGKEIPADDSAKMNKERGARYWQLFRLTCAWKGQTLNNWTLQGLFSNMGYSKEAITLLYRLSGFNGTFLSDMSAGEAYQLLEEFPSNPDFKTLAKGVSTLPNTLVDRIGLDKIYLETQVESIDREDDKYCVHYSTIRQPDVDKADKSVGARAVSGKIKANKVILGLPRLALEKLFIRSSAFNEVKSVNPQDIWNTLQSSSNQPLLKINLYYDLPWWSNSLTGSPAVEFGPNFADLPLGSVYPFYAVDEKGATALVAQEYIDKVAGTERAVSKNIQKNVTAALEEKFTKPAALTIYCDYMNINFWKGLQHAGKPYKARLQDKEVNSRLAPASDLVVEEATKFFKLLFNTHYVPEPILTSARIWSGNFSFYDYNQVATGLSTEGQLLHDAGRQMVNPRLGEQVGYGVHQWALGAKDNLTIKALVEPIPGIFTCGEAFSDYQGWVEGALRSANLVLDKLGVKSLAETDEFLQEFGKRPVEKIVTEAYADLYNEKLEEEFGIEVIASRGVEEEAAAPKKSDQFGMDLTIHSRLQ